MSARTLSAKRQVVLPAELCRQMALVPGAQVQVSLAPDGTGILIRPAASAARKPASVPFGRPVHRGRPVSVDEMQGVAQAARRARASRR
jgi:bifunctional DNA-binding transcriptional regulator/antitoxin component of YhaV-PrlF toxin-antitoxin module